MRCFDDDNIVHVNGRVSPADDIEVINTELALADMASVEKALLRTSKMAKSGNKDELVKKQVLEKYKAALEKGDDPATVKKETDETIRKLQKAIRERAQAVA